MSEPIEPDKLRYIAKSLDVLTGLLRPHFEAGRVTVDGEPLPEDTNALLIDWLTGTEQQDDLRRWADDLEAAPEEHPGGETE